MTAAFRTGQHNFNRAGDDNVTAAVLPDLMLSSDARSHGSTDIAG